MQHGSVDTFLRTDSYRRQMYRKMGLVQVTDDDYEDDDSHKPFIGKEYDVKTFGVGYALHAISHSQTARPEFMT